MINFILFCLKEKRKAMPGQELKRDVRETYIRKVSTWVEGPAYCPPAGLRAPKDPYPLRAAAPQGCKLRHYNKEAWKHSGLHRLA